MTRRVLALICAVLLILCSGCTGEEMFTRSDLERVWQEAYEEGFQDGFDEGQLAGYTEDDMNAAFADGYDSGWHDQATGAQYGDSMTAYMK